MADPTVVTGQSEQYILTAGTADGVDDSLRFDARMVLVDNFSRQYVRVPGGQTWVPPLAQGFRVNIPAGTRRAQAGFPAFGNTYNNPPGSVNVVVAGEVAIVTFLETPVITSAISQSLTVVASTTVAGGGINVPATPVPVTPVTGTTANVIVFQPTTGGLRLTGFSITETAGATANARLIAATAGAASDPDLFDVKLLANESAREWFGPEGIDISAGLFLQRVAGNTKITVFTKLVPTT